MGNTVRTLLLAACLLMFVLLLAVYRIWLVVNRAMPPGLEEADKIRWLDELGRIIKSGSNLLLDLGMGTEPLKILMNTVISLLYNPLPWQRVVYRDIRVSQDMYNGVPVSTYTPVRQRSQLKCRGYPTIIYFHGGGWTLFSVGVYDGFLKHFANITRFKIIAVEYRKSPQHPFPAPFDDCLSATKYIIQHSKELNICRELIVLAGDGSGGNLAAAVANEMPGQIKLQILINPALQMINFATPSYKDFSDGGLLPGISSADTEIDHWMRYGNISPDLKPVMEQNLHTPVLHYNTLSKIIESTIRLPAYFNVTQRQTVHNTPYNDSAAEKLESLIQDSRFNPMFAMDVTKVSDAYIITSQYDVLRDEALMYAHRLQENGVKVHTRHYWHGFHGFLLYAGGGWIQLRESQKALDHLVDYLNKELLG